MICPFCKKEIVIDHDRKGHLSTNDLFTMRIRTPLYVIPGKIDNVSLDICVCSQCKTIIGLGRKM